jgi:cob(I)alamin adenosyltransferase
MNKRKGLIQIYTGEGKGKTSAAIGQAIRAVGNGFKVYIAFFFKDFKKYPSGEIAILKKLGIEICEIVPIYPWGKENITKDDVRRDCLKAIETIRNQLFTRDLDVLVLDEINIALRDNFLFEEEIIELLRQKPEKLEIILTGRGATEKLIQEANLVSKIEKIKHPYDEGLSQREGIEY